MDYNLQKNQNAEQTYHSIRNSIVSAQHRLSTAVNSAMVTTYWKIGEQIFKACGENDRAEYGKKLLEYLSEQLTAEFGKGFDKSNLRKMRIKVSYIGYIDKVLSISDNMKVKLESDSKALADVRCV